MNQLFVNVYLPENFKYGEFTGSLVVRTHLNNVSGMREVSYWSKSIPTQAQAPVGGIVKRNQVNFRNKENAKEMAKKKDAKSSSSKG